MLVLNEFHKPHMHGEGTRSQRILYVICMKYSVMMARFYSIIIITICLDFLLTVIITIKYSVWYMYKPRCH